MSMWDRKDKPPQTKPANVTPMPQAKNVPPPPNRAAPVEQQWAEEALRAAQRAIDQIHEIEHLRRELDTMERRALLAEAEVKRLEQREMVLSQQVESRTMLLGEERDQYRFRLNNLQAQFEAAGSIILKCMDAAKAEMHSHARVNLGHLADQIMDEMRAPLPPAEPLPKAVTAGPRPDSEADVSTDVPKAS